MAFVVVAVAWPFAYPPKSLYSDPKSCRGWSGRGDKDKTMEFVNFKSFNGYNTREEIRGTRRMLI